MGVDFDNLLHKDENKNLYTTEELLNEEDVDMFSMMSDSASKELNKSVERVTMENIQKEDIDEAEDEEEVIEEKKEEKKKSRRKKRSSTDVDDFLVSLSLDLINSLEEDSYVVHGFTEQQMMFVLQFIEGCLKEN
jgi:hypothetical protein